MATTLLVLMFWKQIIDAVKEMLSGLFILIVMAFGKSEKFFVAF